jgi:predicted RNA-binding protein with TRAM domain
MYQDEEGAGGSYGGGGYRGGGRRFGGGGRSSYGGSSEPKPVAVGDELEVKIEAVASKGDGIAKKDGFVIFIKGATEGQTVKIKVTEVKERFAVGEIVPA